MLCTSLLRYSTIIRVDRAFLNAGNACRIAEKDSMSAVFFYRYIEIWDAIEKQDLKLLTKSRVNLSSTDIPSTQLKKLPTKNLMGATEKGLIFEWTRSHCGKLCDQKLPTRACLNC